MAAIRSQVERMVNVTHWDPLTQPQPPLRLSRPGSTELAMASLDDPVVRIHELVYMSPGITNTYLVTTPAGDVVINTGLVVEGAIHRERFSAVRQAPIACVILTQAHVDVVGGLASFVQPGAATEVIAHARSHECQTDDERIKGFRDRRNPRFYPQAMAQLSEADRAAMSRGLAQAHQKATPTLLVDEAHRFTLGGIRFEVLAMPGGETQDSLVVWMPDQRILFTGNCLGPLFPHMPNLHTIRGDRPRPVLPYIETYERLLALNADLLVTGHFEPISGATLIREELIRLRDAVRYIHDATVKGMNEGRDLRALMRDIRLPPELQVGEDYGTVPWAVQAIWYGYGGWFEFRSTTELYPVPVHSIYAELAALAGTDALARRASDLLGQGFDLEAIHLCEVALAADSKHRPALITYLEAHQALLRKSAPRNRWQLYWLQGEIDQAKEKIS